MLQSNTITICCLLVFLYENVQKGDEQIPPQTKINLCVNSVLLILINPNFYWKLTMDSANR